MLRQLAILGVAADRAAAAHDDAPTSVLCRVRTDWRRGLCGRLPRVVSAAVLALLLTAPPALGQGDGPDGFRLGMGLDVSAVSFGGDAARILGPTVTRPGLGYGVRVGYGRGPVVVAAGIELTAVATGNGEALGSLAMPFELQVRPVHIGRVTTGLVVGYVRYGVGDREDIPSDRLPGGATAVTHDVGFLGNALRVGGVVEMPVSRSVLVEARPVADLIRFDQITIREEGDVDLENGGSTWRVGLSVGVVWVL